MSTSNLLMKAFAINQGFVIMQPGISLVVRFVGMPTMPLENRERGISKISIHPSFIHSSLPAWKD